MAGPPSRNSASLVLANLGKLLPDLEPLYKDIHAHPELSMHETRTADIAADRLRKAGYEVTPGVGKTGVVGAAKQAITDLGNMAPPPSRDCNGKWAELRSCQSDATPASSSAAPTGRRSHTSTMSRSRGGARRRRRCHRRVASARADHGKLIAAVRRPPLVINRSLGRILIDTPVADKLLRHPVGAPFGSGRR